MKKDADYITYCEALGKQASAKGNPSIGAIILHGNKIISEAEEATKTSMDIICHAEMAAIRKAAKKLKTTDLSGCVLYSTHEPCIMCAYAIRFYKIRKVVYHLASAYLGSVSSSMPLLTTNDVPPHWGKPPEIIQL